MSEKSRSQRVPKWLNRNQAVVFGVIFLLFLGITVLAKTIHFRTTESREVIVSTGYANVMNSLSIIPSPKGMKPGIVNSETTQVIRTTTEQAAIVEQIARDTNCKFTNYFVMPKHCFDTSNNTARISRSFNEYANVLSSIEDFLEYNPRIDTLKYSPGASQTVERMNKLRDGLSQAKQELERFSVSTVNEDLIKIIESAQEAQIRLEQTGETEPFVILYEKLQEETVKQLEKLYAEAGIKIQNGSKQLLRSIP